MVQLGTEFDRLRYDWIPDEFLGTIHTVADTARAEEHHLWDSTEHHQAYAVGCWLAASGRTMAEALLVGAENTIGFNGSYPKQVVDLATTFYADAEKWYQYAASAYANKGYRVGRENFALPNDWPRSPQATVSPHLMNGLRYVVSLTGNEFSSLEGLFSHVETEVNGPHLIGFFDNYKDMVGDRHVALRRKIDFLGSRWRDDIDPNTEPGLSLYREMVECAQAYVELGVQSLMPATFDQKMRVAVRPKKPRAHKPALPAFDARATSTQSPSSDESTPADTQPTLPTFDSKRLLGTQALAAEQNAPVEPEALPVFDAQKLSDSLQPTSKDVDDKPATLPTFNPGQLLGSQASAGEPAGSIEPEKLPVFDPEKVLGLQQAENETSDDSPTLPTFDPSRYKEDQ